MIRLLFSLFILLYTLPAFAAPKVSVDFNERSNTMYFTFHAKDQQISKQDILFKADLRDRLTFTIKGYKTTRAWKNSWKSNFIKRSLLYPSKTKLQSYLKVRMKSKIPKSVLKRIKVIQKGNKVEVTVPYGMVSKKSMKTVAKKSAQIKVNEQTDADEDTDVDEDNDADEDTDADADADADEDTDADASEEQGEEGDEQVEEEETKETEEHNQIKFNENN